MSPQAALRQLLQKAGSSYGEGQPGQVVGFIREKLSLPRGQEEPVMLRDLLPPLEGELLDSFRFFAQEDVRDFFYRLQIPSSLGKYFSLPPLDLRLLGEVLGEIPEEIQGIAAEHDGPVYPHLKVLPMGFSWAFHLAHMAHKELASRTLPQAALIEDKRPAPRLGAQGPRSAMLIYADNNNHCGLDRGQVDKDQNAMIDALHANGLDTHDIATCSTLAESLGVRVDGLGGTVGPTAARDWRLDRALEACMSSPRMSGAELQIVVGHLTVRALIHRGLMSLLRHCYVFIEECYDKRVRLWPSVVEELGWFRALMPLGVANFFSPWSRTAFSTDACLTGYAVCKAEFDIDELRQVGCEDERWRFYRGEGKRVAPRAAALDTTGVFDEILSVRPEVLDPIPETIELNPMFPEVPEELLREDRWHQLWNAPYSFKEPIHVLEREVATFTRKEAKAANQRMHSPPRGEAMERTQKRSRSPSLTRVSTGKQPAEAGLRQNLKQAAKKRARARRRQKVHAQRLRASRGEKSLLEVGSVTKGTRQDYQNKLNGFYDFVAFNLLETRTEELLDIALLEYCAFLYLDGEDSNYGQKLQAALEYERPETAREGQLKLPRFRRALKGWRKMAPAQTRLPMLEFLKSAVSGLMLHGGFREMALYNEACFSTYARPGEMLKMTAADFVPATKAYSHAVLVLAPFERGESSKTGIYDETLILDDVRAPWLTQALEMHVKERLRTGEETSMWSFTAAKFLSVWRLCTEALDIQDLAVSPYQNRHGGASRDHLMKLRSVSAIQRRGRWASDSSARIYDKPGRLQQMINKYSDRWEAFGDRVRTDFLRCYRDGACQVARAFVQSGGEAAVIDFADAATNDLSKLSNWNRLVSVVADCFADAIVRAFFSPPTPPWMCHAGDGNIKILWWFPNISGNSEAWNPSELATVTYERKKKSQVETLRKIFEELDSSSADNISIKDVETAMSRGRLSNFLESMGISTEDVWTFFMLIDANENGLLDLDEFVSGCMQLNGPARSIQLAKMSYENKVTRREIRNIMEELKQVSEQVLTGASPQVMEGRRKRAMLSEAF
ncbi:unnamed protein product [Symbiodinium sp. CCMP2592]|nr:unnamed protein product [Symbiodinium sp. CCMP2592]